MVTVNGGDWAGRCGDLKAIMDGGRSAELAVRAEALANESADRYETAQALLFALIGRLNERQAGTPVWDDLMERTTVAVAAHPMPALVAELEIMRAGAVEVSHPEEAVTCLVAAQRALADDPADSKASWLAWNDLSANASDLGLSETALAANERAGDLARRHNLIAYDVGVRLEAALVADQHGDTQTCVQRLEELTAHARHHRLTGTGPPVSAHDQLYLEYACARLSALGGDPGLPPSAFPPADHSDTLTNQLVLMANAGRAIARGDSRRALAILDTVRDPEPISSVDLLRLRSLALTREGEHAVAAAVEREMFRRATDSTRRLWRLAVTDDRGRGDHEILAEMLRGNARMAFTDQLTNAPNRRQIELLRRAWSRTGAVVGMIDLDNFKTVNTVHGHRVGDRVLRRAAVLLRRSLRSGDFLARYGGDEFIAVLPETSIQDAAAVGARMRTGISGHNWSDLAPGTPIGVSVGWAALSPGGDFDEALRHSDAAMYTTKTAGRGLSVRGLSGNGIDRPPV